jgi:DNA-binding CsgD family transcriptional regulator
MQEGCDDDRAELLVELGLAKRLIDAPAAVDDLAAGLELVSDPTRRAEVSLELGSALFYLNRIPEAIAAFDGALKQTSRDAQPDLYERLEAELIASAWWTPDTLELAQERIAQLDLDALHGGFGSDLLLADVAFYEARVATDRERAVAAARSALASGNLIASGALGFHYAAFTLRSTGLFDEAIAAYDAALAAAQRRGDVFRTGTLYMFRGHATLLRGDLEAALADLREGLDLIVSQGVDTAVPYAVSFLAEALLDRGEVDEAAAVLDSAGLPEQLPVTGHLFFFQLTRGRVRLELGATERGLAELLELGRRTRLVAFDNPAGYPWRRYAAEALLKLGRREEAVALAEENLVLSRRWGAPYGVGADLRECGVVAGGEEGERLLREAADILAGANARLEHARALVDLGANLRRRNRRAEAREFLRQGADLAHRGGATGLVERANEELAATGARPRKLIVGGIDSLTASERRVAEIAAHDRSNKEIAQELFVTVKTVEVHLSSVYRKLQIGSRRQLAATLAARESEPVDAA